MSLITLPLSAENEQDDVLLMLVATFLARNGVMDISSAAVALRLIVALEQYTQEANLDHLARKLSIEQSTVEVYKAQATRGNKT
jgi:hypothetical protein